MKLLIRLSLTAITIILFSIPSNAQTDEKKKEKKEKKSSKFDESRWVFGGNVSAVFGTVTFVGANPNVGYRLTPRITAGVGGLYYYWNQVGFEGSSVYGPTSYLRFNIAQDFLSSGDRLFAQSDYHVLSTKVYNPVADTIGREWVQQFFVGGGYYMQIGQNVFGGITVQVDLIQDPNSFFRSPYIGGGVSIGL